MSNSQSKAPQGTRRSRSDAVKLHRRALKIEQERAALIEKQLDDLRAKGVKIRVNGGKGNWH
jgi:hypothetical protein